MTAIATLIEAYCIKDILDDYRNQNIDQNELPLGRLNASTTHHLKENLSEALAEKNVSLIVLNHKDPTEIAVKIHGIGEGALSSPTRFIATLEMNPKLFDLDVQAVEWLALESIAKLSAQRASWINPAHAACLNGKVSWIPMGKISLAAIGAVAGRLASGAFLTLPAATTALVTMQVGEYVLDGFATKEGFEGATKRASQEQLKGGIRLLTAEQAARAHVHGKIEAKSPLLAKAYLMLKGDSYLPYVSKLSERIHDLQATYKKAFGEEYAPEQKEIAELTHLLAQGMLENAFWRYYIGTEAA